MVLDEGCVEYELLSRVGAGAAIDEEVSPTGFADEANEGAAASAELMVTTITKDAHTAE
jgi:hypothetical protein